MIGRVAKRASEVSLFRMLRRHDTVRCRFLLRAATLFSGIHTPGSRAMLEKQDSTWRRVWPAALLSLLLGACSPFVAQEPIEVPTLMATAAGLTDLDGLSQPGVIPPTWTPEPASAAPVALSSAGGASDKRLVQMRAPTGTPAAGPIIPTNTPVPTRVPPTATPMDTPTATPYVSYIPDLSPSGELGPSKLGLHVLLNNDPAIMEFVRRANPVVMKAIGDFGFLAEASALSSRTTIIGRVDDIWIQNYIGEPEEAAREYVEKHLPTYQLNPAIDYWEGWNEPDPPTYELMIWYTRFEQERVKLMAQHGLRSAIGGFPQGVPEMDEFALFLPAIETALEYQGILTLHEGDLASGDLRYLYGSPLPGYPAYADRGAGTFRYRWFYKELLEPNNLVIPLVISELNFAGWGHTNENDFIEQLKWYDREIRRDGYVMGFTIFTAGADGFYLNQDVNHILPQLASYVVSQR